MRYSNRAVGWITEKFRLNSQQVQKIVLIFIVSRLSLECT